MLPKNELTALASALKATSEYNEVIKQRRSIMKNSRLGRILMNFEREHARIINHDFSEAQVAPNLKNLFSENKAFLETTEIKAYMQAAQEYHHMITQCVNYLNSLLDVSRTV